MKRINRGIKILLGIFLFLMSTNIVAQTLLKPELHFSSACDDGVVKDFKVTFKYTTSVFASDNKFTIELSDGNGSWDTPINVGAVTIENTSFTFSRTFQLPNDAFGTNYKIRLVASSPEMTSPDSDPFKAYKMITENLILNNFENVVLCDGGSIELTLNTSQKGQYIWYRDGVVVATTIEPVLDASVSGKYQVKIDYGSCGFEESTLIDIIVFSEGNAQIKGDAVIEICGDDAHTFEANVNDSSYTYNWYLNNQLVQSSNSSTYTTPKVGQLGIYYLGIDTGACVTTSSSVTLKQKNIPSFTITENTPLVSVLISGQEVELSITVNGSTTYEVQWYKDGKELFGVDGISLNVNQPGVYVAKVIETASGVCAGLLSSQPMYLLKVKSFDPVIVVVDDNYEDCVSTGVDLKIQQVNVIAEDDNTYVLTPEQLALLAYQWNFNNVNISDATTNELTRSSYTQSGFYTVDVSVGIFNNVSSNELDIKLIAIPPVVTSVPLSNSLCPGGDITYTINGFVTGYTYQWFKEDVDTAPIATDVADLIVTEVGTYILKMTGFGCEKIIETIEVVLFDASAIKVTPSEKVVLVPGEVATVTASGAESYSWYEGKGSGGVLLSTSDVLEVSSIGFYTVVATVGACGVEKIIEVVAQDDQVIVPNIVTPNADGINDTWQLSNKYAFQPTVIIQLYNSNGKEILNISDYKNDWPLESLGNQKIFYYKIIKEDILIKAGTISILD